MSDQNSLFVQNNISQATPAQSPNQPSIPDPVVTMLQEIKNEKGEPKYKTLEDAVKALQHSQAYIPSLAADKQRLEQELADAKAKADKVAELEATVARLLEQKPAATPAQASVDENVIEELVTRSLTRAEAQKTAQQNTQTVIASVAAKFGDKAEEVFYGKAAELGMSRAEINQLAATKPKAVLSLLGIQDTVVPQQNSRQSTQTSAINSVAIPQQSDSFVGRNKEQVIVGATTQQLMQENQRAKKMVDELHAQGKTVHDLTDPKVYFKYFG